MKSVALATVVTALSPLPMNAAISIVGGLPNGALFTNPSVAESGARAGY